MSGVQTTGKRKVEETTPERVSLARCLRWVTVREPSSSSRLDCLTRQEMDSQQSAFYVSIRMRAVCNEAEAQPLCASVDRPACRELAGKELSRRRPAQFLWVRWRKVYGNNLHQVGPNNVAKLDQLGQVGRHFAVLFCLLGNAPLTNLDQHSFPQYCVHSWNSSHFEKMRRVRRVPMQDHYLVMNVCGNEWWLSQGSSGKGCEWHQVVEQGAEDTSRTL